MQAQMLPEFLQRVKSLLRDLTHSDKDSTPVQLHQTPVSSYEYISSGKTVASIQNRAKVLLNEMKRSKSDDKQLRKLAELVTHMKKYPVTRNLLIREGGISVLLRLRRYTLNEQIKMSARVALTILGFTDPVKEHGIRILSLDGGGAR